MQSALAKLMDAGAEFCDVLLQETSSAAIRSINGRVRDLDDRRSSGIRVRVWKAGRWGYSSSIRPEKAELYRCCDEALRNAHGTEDSLSLEAPSLRGDFPAKVRIHPDDVPLEEKLRCVLELDKAQTMEGVVNRIASYSEEVKKNILVNSSGADLSWEELRTRFRAMSVASDGSRLERYYDGPDSSLGFETVNNTDIEALGRRTATEAVRTLEAAAPPSGRNTVISDPMVTGLLAHEVIGHASEADEVVRQRSFLMGMMGRKVGSEIVTLVDDGAVPGAHGSIPFDDEGSPGRRTEIIKEGIYTGYINDLLTASIMGAEPTGNGRAQDFGRRVWVRMTNTFIEPGDCSIEEIIAETDEGVICDKMVNGMEDPVGGGFEAKVLRGFLVRNGELGPMVRSFTLTGKALEILQTVDMVSDKLELDGGMCGKGIEDWVNVSSGGPYLRSRIIVGGA